MKRTFFKAKVLLCLTSLIVLLVFYGCGGGGGGGGDGGDAPKIYSGSLIDSPIAGVEYITATQHGVTDAQGTFKYQSGETVSFYVGGVFLGSTLGKAIITPIDLVEGATDVYDPVVTNIAQFLQSLDEDQNLTNGIKISEAAIAEILTRNIDITDPNLDFDNNVNIQNLFSAIGNIPVSAEEAQQNLLDYVDGSDSNDTVNVTGTWVGEFYAKYGSNFSGGGPIVLNLSQTGNDVYGSVIPAQDCQVNTTGKITGNMLDLLLIVECSTQDQQFHAQYMISNDTLTVSGFTGTVCVPNDNTRCLTSYTGSLTRQNDDSGGGVNKDCRAATIPDMIGTWDLTKNLGAAGIDIAYQISYPDGKYTVYDYAGDSYDDYADCYWVTSGTTTDLGNGMFLDSFDQTVMTVEICGDTLHATAGSASLDATRSTVNSFTPLCDDSDGLIGEGLIGTWNLISPPGFQDSIIFDGTHVVINYGDCTESATYEVVSDSIFTVTTTSATCYAGPYGETFDIPYALDGDSLTIFGDVEYHYRRQ